MRTVKDWEDLRASMQKEIQDRLESRIDMLLDGSATGRIELAVDERELKAAEVLVRRYRMAGWVARISHLSESTTLEAVTAHVVISPPTHADLMAQQAAGALHGGPHST